MSDPIKPTTTSTQPSQVTNVKPETKPPANPVIKPEDDKKIESKPTPKSPDLERAEASTAPAPISGGKPIDEPEPEPEFRVGDRVALVGTIVNLDGGWKRFTVRMDTPRDGDNPFEVHAFARNLRKE